MRVCQLLLLAGLFLLVPSPARAWGPAAHLEFGLAVLKDLALLAPAVAVLLRRFRDDFLYGNIAADITVGKNLSPYHLHCHNWQVGLSVLDLAEDDATRAFAWGYLSHLAADVVAHNYFVPYKIVQHFHRRRAAHVYWEMRFDTWMQEDTWQVARTLSTRAFKKHDRHLRKILTGPLFSFRVNKQIFNSIVLFSQVLRWKRTVDAYARSTTMRLTREEVEEMHRMSIDRVMNLMIEGVNPDCLNADPTGHRNILIARDIRKRLRSAHLEKRLLNPQEIGVRFRQLFKEAMDSKLALPSMLELIDGDKAPQPAKMRTFRRRKKPYRKPRAPRRKRGLLTGKKPRKEKPGATGTKEQKKKRRKSTRAKIRTEPILPVETKGKKLLARFKTQVLDQWRKVRKPGPPRPRKARRRWLRRKKK